MPLDREVIEALEAVVGAEAVDETADAIATSSHDTWPVSTKLACLKQHPYPADVVVRLPSFAELPGVLSVATRFSVPVTVRALASSVTGQPLPVRGGIVLDVSAIPASFAVNEQNMTVTVTASMNGGVLEDALVARGLTLGHSPQSLYRSTVGGWLATLATGQFSSLYGGIEDLVTGYVVVLATGEVVELKASPRAAMGPDLRQVFLGSEGTLGVITSVTLKVFPLQPSLFAAFALPTVEAGLEIMREQALAGIRPLLLRLYDVDEARHAMVDPGFATPVMFVGTRGPARLAETQLDLLREMAQQRDGRDLGPAPVEAWMGRRFDFSTVENLLASVGGYGETIEVAHNWDGIRELYHDVKAALSPLADQVLVHFSHVYTQGTSMYVILLGTCESDADAVELLGEIWATTMQVCLAHGAELSHHHGGGLARSPYSRRSLGSAHLVLERVKAALDPAGILNPGKLGL